MAAASNSKSAAVKEAFPSPVEVDVASSLLLLSTFTITPPPRAKGEMEKKSIKKKIKVKLKLKKKSSLKFTSSKSHLSSPTSSTVTTENNADQRMKVISVMAKFHEMMKLKVVRKRRSKSLSISNCRKIWSSGKPEPSLCLSSSCSSAISSGGIVINSSTQQQQRVSHLFFAPPKRRPVLGSAHMRRRAEAILKVLSSCGCASEVKIRELLGDSPSTSKALRILLNLEQVKRSGAGGRTDPYIYMRA